MITVKQHSDDTMAKLYSSCDITLAPGCSEGFGLPIFESLACGTPCIHGNNGGAPEHMPSNMLVEPKIFRLEGTWACARPVFDPMDWVAKIEALGNEPVELPAHLAWNNLWPVWERWLRKGVPHDADGIRNSNKGVAGLQAVRV